MEEIEFIFLLATHYVVKDKESQKYFVLNTICNKVHKWVSQRVFTIPESLNSYIGDRLNIISHTDDARWVTQWRRFLVYHSYIVLNLSWCILSSSNNMTNGPSMSECLYYGCSSNLQTLMVHYLLFTLKFGKCIRKVQTPHTIIKDNEFPDRNNYNTPVEYYTQGSQSRGSIVNAKLFSSNCYYLCCCSPVLHVQSTVVLPMVKCSTTK